MKIRYEAGFEKDLRCVRTNKNLLNKIKELIEEIKQADEISSVNNIKKLKGYDSFYRIRIGDYRIGIEIVDCNVIFARILHRKDIYRYFP